MLGRPKSPDGPFTTNAQDQIVYTLLILGPMTLEDLSAWMGRDNYAVNNWLYMLRRKGLVMLTERGEHRNRYRMKCGKWALTPEATR